MEKFEIDHADLSWYVMNAVMVSFLYANKDNVDLDKPYILGTVEAVLSTMPVGVQEMIDGYLSSEYGQQWLAMMRQQAQDSPYISDDRLKDE